MGAIPGVKVIRSGIHGYGAVATRPFKAGDLIADIEGILYHEDDEFDDTYALTFEDGYFWDMVDQTRWMNHHCEPNGEIEGEREEEDGGPFMRIRAIRDIEPGEEITYDYAFSAELAEKCNCGAATCRGWIIDPDELPELEKRLASQA